MEKVHGCAYKYCASCDSRGWTDIDHGYATGVAAGRERVLDHTDDEYGEAMVTSDNDTFDAGWDAAMDHMRAAIREGE